MLERTGSKIKQSGKIRNHNGYFTDDFNYQIDFEIQDIIDNEHYQTAVVYDGIIINRHNNDDLTTDIIINGVGNHSVDLKRLPALSSPYNYIHYAYGNNVYLKWEQSLDSDLAFYIIKKNDIEIARVDEIVVYEKYYARLGTGGRYSVSGVSPDLFNGNLSVIFGVNSFTFNGLTYEFLSAGTSYSLDYGVNLTLHDSPDLYQDFDIFIGVDNEVVLNNQAYGLNEYEIIPVDIAGNIGDAIDKQAFIHAIPAEIQVTNNAFTADFNVIDKVNLYADYSYNNQFQLDYIYLDSPVRSYTNNSTINNLPIGTKYYLFPVIEGIEHKNFAQYEIKDLTIIEGSLGIPADLELTAIAGGYLKLTWSYELEENDKCDNFIISGTIDDITPYGEIVSFSENIKSNNGLVINYEFTLPLYFNSSKVALTITARDENNIAGISSDIVIAYADDDAPAIAGAIVSYNI